MKSAKKYSVVGFLTMIVVAGCSNPISGPTPTAKERLTIENDERKLAGRAQLYEDEVLMLHRLEPGQSEQVAETGGFELRVRAEVQPPALDGPGLHASHVTVSNGFAYVAYSTPNDAYSGAVEVYDIQEIGRPRLISQARLHDSDVRIAVRHDARVYLGEANGAGDSGGLSSPACLEVLELHGNKLTAESRLVDLPSFSANDLVITDQRILVTSGTTGGAISVLDINTLAVLERIEVERAKAVDVDERHIVVMEGTGTRLHVYDRNSVSLLRTIEIGEPNFFEAKAEIDLVNDKVFLSAWENGMKVIDLTSGIVVGSVSVPAGGVCNGVAVAGDYLFMANGLHGMLVAQITDSGIVPVGRAVFQGSTNFVTARGNQIFVANGRGGFIYLELFLGGKDLFP